MISDSIQSHTDIQLKMTELWCTCTAASEPKLQNPALTASILPVLNLLGTVNANTRITEFQLDVLAATASEAKFNSCRFLQSMQCTSQE